MACSLANMGARLSLLLGAAAGAGLVATAAAALGHAAAPAAALAGATLALLALGWWHRAVRAPLRALAAAWRRPAAAGPAIPGAGRQDEIGVLAAGLATHRATLERCHALQRETELERARLDRAIAGMPIGLAMYDGAHRLIAANRRVHEIYDMGAVSIGSSYVEIQRLIQGTPEGETPQVPQAIREGRPFSRLVDLPDGRTVCVQSQPLPDGGWVSTHEDVTDRKRTEARLAHLAVHDALTDLPNRGRFQELADAVLARVPPGEGAAVLWLNLDRFREVNEVLGHACGDTLLRQVAARLRNVVRDSDVVARLGGDDFAVVQPGLRHPDIATQLAERLIGALSGSYTLEGGTIEVGVSVGIAYYPEDADTADALLAKANIALTRAKADGRGLYRAFEPAMDARLRTRRALERELRQAIADGALVLHYQPQARVIDGRILGFEALVRWPHPERGMISPGEFIPLAEETGLIRPLGEWVLRTACAAATQWPSDIRLSVNLSPVQFRPDLASDVAQVLEETGLAPHRLELEITEGVLIRDSSMAIGLLEALKRLGVQIAMDDFGTGYSSLGYLQRFPFNRIKVDRSFITGLPGRQESKSILRAIIGLGDSLNMGVVAEGVETEAQFATLRREGCEEVQGYFIARPMAPEAVLPFLETHGAPAALAS